MKVLKSLISALSMYTIIPMPSVSWDEDCRKYILGVFPATGLVVAGFFYLLYFIIDRVDVFIPWNVFYMAGAVIPAIITGGIHLDGFMDTADALGSNAPREKKLEIMKDPRCGAFGVIALIIYFILYMAGLSMVRSPRQVLFVGISFVLSRALSGLALLTLPGARENGLAESLVKGSTKLASLIMVYIWVILSVIGSCALYGRWGGVLVIVSLFFFFFYEVMSLRVFGGLTGDLAGWFLCLYELLFAWLVGLVGFFWFV